MTVAMTLLVSAALAGWLGPRWLGRADLRRHDPLVLMVTWLLSMAGVVFAVVMGVVLLMVPDHGDVASLLATLHYCWDAVRHGSPPAVEALGGLVGSVLVIAMAVRLITITVRARRKRASQREEHLSVLRLAGRAENGPPPVTLWLTHDQPMAFSLSGRPGVIVATEGLHRHLPAESVAAVLAHERAHLRGRHHLLVAMTDALRTAMPFVPLFRRAPDSMRDLVELSADISAVRKHGAAAVKSALTCVTGQVPGGALAMARDAVEVRLARLHNAPNPPGAVRRTLSCGLAGLVAATTPLLAATAFLIMIGVATCSLTGA